MTAMEKKAQAEVAYDVAVTDQLTDKPDSVLALTCFNQAAGVSALEGGKIFSEDFTTDLAPIIETALDDIYQGFADADGFESTVVDYSATTLDSTFDCPEMEDLWTRVKEQGVNAEVPYPTFNDLATGAVPTGAGTDFVTDWNAAAGQNVFSELQTAVTDLPDPDIPDFTGAETSCQVLVAAEVIAGPCP